MSPLSDALNDPTSVLQELYETYKGDNFQEYVAQYFEQLFGSESQISLVTTVHDADHSNPRRQPCLLSPDTTVRSPIQQLQSLN